jgi:hypothetical protein
MFVINFVITIEEVFFNLYFITLEPQLSYAFGVVTHPMLKPYRLQLVLWTLA